MAKWERTKGLLASGVAVSLLMPCALLAQSVPAGSARPAVAATQVSGTVTDVNGGVVPNATVTITDAATGAQRGSAATNSDGFFQISGAPGGSYSVTASAPGFAKETQTGVTLHGGEVLDLPHFVLPLASASTDMQVVYSPHLVAEEQIHAEEKQRLLGVIPNFYSSYVWDAEPLSPGQKFHLALRSAIDPVGFLGTAVAAGVQQDRNTNPGFGQGAAGYGKRYGSLYADDLTGVFLGRAILPVLFHQDPRFFYKSTGTTRERAEYALTRAFVQRGDNGKWQPAYSSLLGNFASGALSNLYLTSRDRNGASTTIENGFLGVGFNMADGLLREFLWKRITKGGGAAQKEP